MVCRVEINHKYHYKKYYHQLEGLKQSAVLQTKNGCMANPIIMSPRLWKKTGKGYKI
jgi:hypothetical protein